MRVETIAEPEAVPCCRLEIQTMPPLGHSVVSLGHEIFLVATVSGVTVTPNSVINKLTYGTLPEHVTI
jgi:hypothetical protein